MSLMDWEKLNFTYITYKLAKSNLGNLCLQFKSAPFISMLSPTYKLYMSSKFQKLFASPIRKKQSPSRMSSSNLPASLSRLRMNQSASKQAQQITMNTAVIQWAKVPLAMDTQTMSTKNGQTIKERSQGKRRKASPLS